jgi:hypothetical protein
MPQMLAKLDELLVDDCHVRFALGLVGELVADLVLRAKAIEQSLSSRTRFLPTIGRPEELAAVGTAKAELDKAKSALESLQRLHVLIESRLPAQIEAYLLTASEPYQRGVSSLENLQVWPRMVDRLAGQLAELLRALGQARNMASSGYDWKTRTFSPMAAELIAHAQTAAQVLDDGIVGINAVADRHHMTVAGTPHAAALLPRVPVVGFHLRIEQVTKMSISEVQAGFNTILETCSLLESVGIAGLREAMTGLVDQHRELGHAYVMTYLTQLRTHMDKHRLDPGQLTQRIKNIQQRYLGETNFPFELDA